MENGTAVGLLVGGAVLLLAVAPRRPGTTLPNGQPAPAAGGVLNPWNFLQSNSNPFRQASQPPLFPIPQPGSTPAYAQNPGYQNIGYTPSPGASDAPWGAWTPNGNDTQNPYGTGAYQGAVATPAAYPFPVMTPAGGFQSMSYMSQAPGGGMSANNASPAQSLWV